MLIPISAAAIQSSSEVGITFMNPSPPPPTIARLATAAAVGKARSWRRPFAMWSDRLRTQDQARIQRLLELRFGRPRLAHLLDDGTPAHRDALSFVADLTGERESSTPLKAELAELENVWAQRREMLLANSSFPLRWDAGDETCRALYLLVRTTRPDHILETGVANGRSTWWLLQALNRNGHGQLHSFDICEDVGHYLSTEDRANWDIQVVRARRVRSWSKALNSLPPLDLFIHDSHHTYRWQRVEYAGALQALRSGGILATDDADASYAFSVFCSAVGLQAHYLLDQGKIFKVFGAARCPSVV